jgi:hypothetical protein
MISKKYLCVTLVLLILSYYSCYSQVSNTGLADTTGGIQIEKLSIGGYIDLYYGNHFSHADNDQVPYFVSMSRANELNVNLAYIDLRYHNPNFRARLIPGFGTYMNANYSAEPATLKNLVECSAGIKLSKSKEIWLDAGILGSSYTNESAISKDHLMYTRSLAPEYVPYYLSGVKLSVVLNSKINAYLFLLNGWQQIQDQNSGKSIGTQIEYRPNTNHLINWNTYIGDERSAASPDFRMRYFSDIYWIFKKNKYTATACFYVGNQTKQNPISTSKNHIWWQGNIIGQYAFNEKFSLAGRLEYFNDIHNIQISPITGNSPFKTFSGGLCLNVKVDKNAMFRLEGRQFFSDELVYTNRNNTPIKSMTWLVSNITVWF